MVTEKYVCNQARDSAVGELIAQGALPENDYMVETGVNATVYCPQCDDDYSWQEVVENGSECSDS